MMDITFMQRDESKFEFLLPEHIKQSRPGYTPPAIILPAFPSNEALCVFSHMGAYINWTSALRGDETKLFISHIKPHRQASRDTISRWIRETMTNAGVDTSTFKPHSTISAATSKAKAVAVHIQDILNRAGWSSSRTFDRFYSKPVQSEGRFATAILNS